MSAPGLAERARHWTIALTRRPSVTGSEGARAFGPWFAGELERTAAFAGAEVWTIPVAPGDGRHCVAMLLRGSGVATVILTFRGPLYLYGKGFNERIRVKISSSDDPSRSSIDTFRYGLAATLDALSRLGKKTILVLDQAELGFDPRSCINSRPLWLTGHEIRDICAVPRTDFDKRNNEYRHMIQEVVKDRPDVKVFDTAEKPVLILIV